jgi:two-component system sensor histidine kinase CiaH
MSLSYYKTKKLRFIFIGYWFLLAYIIVALVFWFIELNKQNQQMVQYRMEQLKKDDPQYYTAVQEIEGSKNRKTTQYIGEGSIFLFFILTGAFYIMRALRRQFKQAQQQQNFMMTITHELKTPIAITKLNLETLQKRKLDESQQQHLIQNTIQEANRLNTLCNNLLLASQMETGKFTITKEAIDLGQLANECVNDFAIRFPQRTINADIDHELFIIGDRLLLQMGINNLIDNAIKYSPKETAVVISTKKQGNFIDLSVKDHGKGIEDIEKKKVFDKFYRAGKKDAKGTGLGLYLTKKIVQQHNANIFVTDNIPAGSIFTILFKNNS